ncbi:hypothetical protein [Deinococcus sp.]|uniref:hypothetical protein n=1 Tax=Deinococcus sp. TaxID=47478 RepID=UPI003C79E380
MKPLVPLLGLTALLSACGTGLIPPVTQNLPDINATLTSATAGTPMVIYPKTNQFDSSSPLAGSVNSVTISGTLVYTGLGNLSGVGVYVRENSIGCIDGGTFVTCTGDESANKIQDLSISKGTPVSVSLSGKQLTAAVQRKSGLLGFQVTSGSSLNGDKINITDVKAVVRF